MVSGSPDVSNSFVSPNSKSFVSQSGWWCPALRMSPICLPLKQFICLQVWLVVSGSPDVSNLSPLIAIHLSPSLAGGVRLSGCLQFVSPYSNSFVSLSGWWCPAVRMSPIHLFALIAIHLSPSLAGGVRLFRCLQSMCFPLWQFICLPVWLVVSGSPDVSNLSPSLAGVRLSGCLQFVPP